MAVSRDAITAGTGLDIIAKVDEERRLVLGWLNVNKTAGKYVVDRQGDIIPDRELEDAIIEFGLNSRVGKVMHNGKQVARGLVFPMTDWVQKALGVDMGKGGAIGLWIIEDDAAWQAVKAGSLKSFSLGGRAYREDALNGR
jgi:hypothetical protein